MTDKDLMTLGERRGGGTRESCRGEFPRPGVFASVYKQKNPEAREARHRGYVLDHRWLL